MAGREPTIEAELELLQRESFSYFVHETHPANGLVIDKTAPVWPASIAAIHQLRPGIPARFVVRSL